MPKFSIESRTKLETCHNDLVVLFNEVIKSFDCKVTCGKRDKKEQDAAFSAGKSKLTFPHSKHNIVPPQTKSRAVDVYPYPIDMKDLSRFYYFAGFVKGVADQLYVDGLISHKIIWGGDWDDDTEVKDNSFNDLCHFEIVGD